jgi:hypothetical protein
MPGYGDLINLSLESNLPTSTLFCSYLLNQAFPSDTFKRKVVEDVLKFQLEAKWSAKLKMELASKVGNLLAPPSINWKIQEFASENIDLFY